MSTYIIHGNPHQQERPRASTTGRGSRKKIVLYDPPRSRTYKKHIINTLQTEYNPIPTSESIEACIDVYVPIPKSFTLSNKEKAKLGQLKPSKKPDLSNYVKLIEDACNGLLYKDDSQIVNLTARKRYSDEPRIEITIKPIPPF